MIRVPPCSLLPPVSSPLGFHTMPRVPLHLRLGNKLYDAAFPLYRILYSVYKSVGDRREFALLKKILRPGMTAVDVGANIGHYALVLAKLVGREGEVHCFEPSPDNYRRLTRAAGPHPQIKTYPNIVTNRSGDARLFVSSELNVDHRTHPTGDGNREEVAVPGVALDDVFEPGTKIDLLKMDIQGHEFQALTGARRILGENREINLILEFWPHGLREAGDSAEALVGLLKEEGFHIQTIDPREGLVPYPPAGLSEDASWYCNLFAARAGD